jgi:hypothetical protein
MLEDGLPGGRNLPLGDELVRILHILVPPSGCIEFQYTPTPAGLSVDGRCFVRLGYLRMTTITRTR